MMTRLKFLPCGMIVLYCTVSSMILAENPGETEQKVETRIDKTVPSPEEAARKMTLQKGFQVQVFAGEPDVIQPFAFCIDDKGRIWVAENLNYETRGSDTYKDGPKGRIIILEDTNGDGQFDKRKVFIEKIFFPSGLEVGHGGVWVGSPPNLLFIPDRNRDDVPDGEPEIVLDGWGRHDRHETLNSFCWGPDGWLYGCHGVFTHSKVGRPGTPEKDRVPINAGVWRYHPIKKQFEVFGWGTSNPWGLDFDRNGQAFVTACVIPHLYHIIQGGRFRRQAGNHFSPYVFNDIKTIADHRHKSAHGGARFYLADQFPEKYRDRLFMCNIHEHAMLTDILDRKGSGFVARHGDSFLLSNDEKFLGFNLEIGPEGSVYVIDWHDGDICGRKILNLYTGRIYRISHGKVKAKTNFDLASLSDAELVQLQLHQNDWYVRHARRVLHERAVSGKLDAITNDKLKTLLKDHPKIDRKLRILWTLHLTKGLRVSELQQLLWHENEQLRAWTIQLLCEDRNPSDEAMEKFAAMAKEDDSPLVRLYLASALQRIPLEKRWDIAMGLVSHGKDMSDHNLPLMYWYGIEPLVKRDQKRIVKLISACQIPVIRQYIARRLTFKEK